MFVDFHDEITVEDGRKIRLEEVLGARAASAKLGKENAKVELQDGKDEKGDLGGKEEEEGGGTCSLSNG